VREVEIEQIAFATKGRLLIAVIELTVTFHAKLKDSLFVKTVF
jgi:hypothetical protein